MLIRRFFAFVISVFLFLSLPLNAANAASSWSITSAVSAGSRTVVSATKSGYKSAVNIAPSAVRLGVGMLRLGNTAALLYAAAQLASDGIDFVIEPENNRIKYKFVKQDVSDGAGYLWTNAFNFVGTAQAAAADSCAKFNRGALVSYSYTKLPDTTKMTVICANGSGSAMSRNAPISDEYKYLSIPEVSAQVLKNAAAGNSQAQSAVRSVATEMVVSGQFDQDLLAGAVPTSDSRPLVPSVPISGNGNVTHGADTGIGDDGMSGASPGEQSDAAKDAADKAKKAAQAAAEAAKDAAQAAADAAADAADLVNSGADAAAVAAAEAAKAAAEKAAADAKAVSDAAVAAANERAAAAERAAEAATQAAQAAAAQAAADVAAAQAAGDAAAVAAAEAAKAAADAAVAAAKEKQAAAEKAAEKAKAEAAKPFELPAFCSWATPVCDFIEWFKGDVPSDLPPQDVPFATTSDIGLDDVDRFEQRIQFSGQCPSNDFSFTMMGVTYAKPIPYHYLCGFLEQIAPWLLAMCYLGTAYFVVENI